MRPLNNPTRSSQSRRSSRPLTQPLGASKKGFQKFLIALTLTLTLVWAPYLAQGPKIDDRDSLADKVLGFLSGVSPAQASSSQTYPELERLLSLKPPKKGSDNVKSATLGQAARKVAAETGAKVRYQEILSLIEPMAPELDAVFNFQPLVQKRGRLTLEPPIVTIQNELMTLEGRAAQGQGLSYRVIRGARLLSHAPTWRSYLNPPLLALPNPEEIHFSLWPEDSAEKDRWRKEIQRGWIEGVNNANQTFVTALNLLIRDYLGLVLFYELEKRGLVQGPAIGVASDPKIPLDSERVSGDGTLYVIKNPGGLTPKKPASKSKSPKSPKRPKPKKD
ncbi:MAG: type IV secretion system DotC family protein [Deltaproteobacteria bacterium]|nr:type IV secretion system DotC family protein [Deltaproteobacteria bacterium]